LIFTRLKNLVIETNSIDQNGTVLPECASDMDQRFDLKMSLSESSQEDLRETLKGFPKLTDVKALFDTFMLHQQESLRQQHQEILSFQAQQMQQMQVQHVLLQHQQHLLEQQQQQLTQQQLKLEQIARQQMPLDLPAANCNALFPSAPPLSIDMDEHNNH
jgi:predicted membrane chloride channel (bestrophin family)